MCIPLCSSIFSKKIDDHTIKSLEGTKRLIFAIMIISTITAVIYVGALFALNVAPSQLQLDMGIAFALFAGGCAIALTVARIVTINAIKHLKEQKKESNLAISNKA